MLIYIKYFYTLLINWIAFLFFRLRVNSFRIFSGSKYPMGFLYELIVNRFCVIKYLFILEIYRFVYGIRVCIMIII